LGRRVAEATLDRPQGPGPPEHPRLRWVTRRRFDPSSSPSARSADPLFSPSDLLSNQAQYPWPFSNLGTGLLAGRIAPLFSERPVSLRTSGLHRFSTVLEIQSIRVAYELHRNAVGKYRLDRREPPISKLMRQGAHVNLVKLQPHADAEKSRP
jgi:hypothetical protein